MSDAPPRPTLVHSVLIRAAAEDVWRAITDPRWTEQYFFGLAVRSDWRRGSRILYQDLAGEAHMEGTVTEVEPQRRLRYSVRLLKGETAADLPSRVTWEIEARGSGCLVTVVHDEFEGESATYRSVAGGWPTALAGLKELLETNRASQAQSTWPDHLPRPEAGSHDHGA